MAGLNSALQIGRNALKAHQIGLNVTGDNIANVNTPGYSRKTPLLKPSVTVDGVGTGVRVQTLTRARDRFLDSQFRFESSEVGRLSVLERAMSTIEAIFSELAGGGATEPGAIFNQSSGIALTGSFSRFFTSWQDLANNPESQTGRAVVVEEGKFLADQFHRMDEQLGQLSFDIDLEFQDAILEANRITQELAKLNIKISLAAGNPTDVVGDLNDERDRLIDDLSKFIQIRSRQEEDGTVSVTAGGGILLVDRGFSTDLTIKQIVREGAVVADLAIGDGRFMDPGSGEFQGFVQARDLKIKNFRSSLDTVASNFVTEINKIHSAGFGLDGSSGTEFFEPTGTTARLIGVNSSVANNLDLVAASASSTGTGDNTVALDLSDVRNTKVFAAGTQTVEEFYSDLIGRIGAESFEIQANSQTQQLILEQVTTRRQNVQGVSINEEATQLIIFQRAFQAAARVVTIVDELFDTVLNMHR